MKILRVIASMDPAKGGPCQGIRNFIPELEKLGVQNEVVSLDNPKAAFLGDDDFPVYALGPTDNPWAYNGSLISWLHKNFHRFDVVVVHGLWLYHGYAVRKAISQMKKRSAAVPKFFVMPHGMLDPYFQRAPDRKLKAVRNWLYWKLIEGNVVNEADGILYTCEEELVLGRQTFRPYRPKRAINVGYGIARPVPYHPGMTDAFLKKCPELHDQPYLLFLSRIHSKKGLDLLINAYREIVKEGQKIPKLVIAGPGLDSSFGKRIDEKVQKDDVLRSSVFFTGMLIGEAKWGAFYGCEAFVLPSHQENFGIAVVEAMACGKPVLISDQVNIWREIQAEGAGVIGADDLEATRQMIKAWIRLSVDEKKAMGYRAKKCFDQKFDLTLNATKYLDAIQL